MFLRKIFPPFIVFVSLFFLCNCSQKTEFLYSHDFPSYEWKKDDAISVTFSIDDTTALYDVVLRLTNTNDYLYANLYLFSTIFASNNTQIRDTVEFFLSDNAGNWIGKGWFSYTNTYLFRRGIRFPHQGEYTFLFEQAMRCKNKQCSVFGIKKFEFELQKR